MKSVYPYRDCVSPSEREREENKEFIQHKYQKYFGKKTKRIFKSHHQAEFFFEYIEALCNEFEIFYIVREGKDVLVSEYHYFLNNKDLPHKPFPVEENFSKFIRLNPTHFPHDGPYSYIPSSNYVQRWTRHVTGWLSLQDKITIIRYESLHSDFENVMHRVSQRLQWLIDAPIRKPTLKQRSINPRKGLVGDWTTLFSKDDQDYFQTEAADTLNRLNTL